MGWKDKAEAQRGCLAELELALIPAWNKVWRELVVLAGLRGPGRLELVGARSTTSEALKALTKRSLSMHDDPQELK